MVDTISGNDDLTHTHSICFDVFDEAQDVFELRHDGGNSSLEISVNLINKGESTSLYFGKNANLTSITVAEHNKTCLEDLAVTDVIRIQNGTIIESGCVGK